MAGISMNRREITNVLKHNGFIYERSHGGHDIYKRGGQMAVVPRRPNALICQKYIREYDLKV